MVDGKKCIFDVRQEPIEVFLIETSSGDNDKKGRDASSCAVSVLMKFLD